MYTSSQEDPGGSNAMMDLRVRLRPMGVGDILDETFRLYRANAMLFAAIVAVLEVPAQVIAILFSLAAPQAVQPVPGQDLTQQQINTILSTNLSSAGYSSVGALVTTFASVLIAAALAWAISNRYLGRAVTVGEAYSAVGGRIAVLILAALWVGVRLILMFVTVIGIPFAIYFAIAWTLLSQAIMLEGNGIGAASARSRELVRGYWWKTLGLLLVVGIMVAIIGGIVVGLVGGVVAIVFPHPGYQTLRLITGVAQLIVGVVLTPIQIVATTLLFYDLKIRKEAFDLEAMVGQASGDVSASYNN